MRTPEVARSKRRPGRILRERPADARVVRNGFESPAGSCDKSAVGHRGVPPRREKEERMLRTSIVAVGLVLVAAACRPGTTRPTTPAGPTDPVVAHFGGLEGAFACTGEFTAGKGAATVAVTATENHCFAANGRTLNVGSRPRADAAAHVLAVDATFDTGVASSTFDEAGGTSEASRLTWRKG
jgi:hypothetical protein